jgi:hypothetical protein
VEARQDRTPGLVCGGRAQFVPDKVRRTSESSGTQRPIADVEHGGDKKGDLLGLESPEATSAVGEIRGGVSSCNQSSLSATSVSGHGSLGTVTGSSDNDSLSLDQMVVDPASLFPVPTILVHRVIDSARWPMCGAPAGPSSSGSVLLGLTLRDHGVRRT